jgi:hypothetical protein
MTNQEDENLHKADQVYFLYDPQPVRLLDVIYVGPVMIYAGIKGKNLNPFVKWSLIGVGICTILYNGANFFINEKKAMEKRKADKAHKDELNNFVPEPLENEEAIVKKKDDEAITNAVIEDRKESDFPTQVEVGEVEGTDDFQPLSIPKEVQEILNMANNTTNEDAAIVKKGRGRPTKTKTEETQLALENGSHQGS